MKSDERVWRAREARYLREAVDELVAIEGARTECDERGPYLRPYSGGVGARAKETWEARTPPYYHAWGAKLFQELVALDRAGSRSLTLARDSDEAVLQRAHVVIGRWERGEDSSSTLTAMRSAFSRKSCQA